MADGDLLRAIEPIIQASKGEGAAFNFSGLAAKAEKCQTIQNSESLGIAQLQFEALAAAEDAAPDDNAGTSARTQLAGHLSLFCLGLATLKLPCNEQAEFIKNTFFQLARGEPVRAGRKDMTFGGWLSRIAVLQLNFLDQFVQRDVRANIYNVLKSLPKEIRTAYPPLIEYFWAWNKMEQTQVYFDAIRGGKARSQRPVVYVFASTKGGVGKSTCSLALAHYLRGALPKEKCAVVDLDFSGPSLQFHMVLDDVARFTNLIPKNRAAQSLEWTYPSLADLVLADEDPRKGKRETAEGAVARMRATIREKGLIMEGHEFNKSRLEKVNTGFVVLPDSPSLCSDISAEWDDPDEGRNKFFDALTAIIDELQAEGYERVIIDMRPGLYGWNGLVLRHISQSYSTRLMLVGTPRLADFATTMYETSWLTASGEFQWAGPTQYLINLWDQTPSRGESPSFSEAGGLDVSTLDELANALVVSALEEAANGGGPRSSARQLYSMRIWPYFYYRGGLPVASARKVHVTLLPFDRKLKRLQDLSRSNAALDFGVLAGSDWYSKGLRPVFERMLKDDESQGSC